jgi:hypothetical protein
MEGFLGVRKPRCRGRGIWLRLVPVDMVESGDIGREADEKRVLMLNERAWDRRDVSRLDEG